jgi:large subunit ribosomal protein L24
MKQKFSKKWKASKQPRKQRKYNYNAPLHLKRKMMASTLDKELRKKYGTRNIVIKKGDEVKIMRGKYKKKQGKVDFVSLKKMKVRIDGIQNTKKDGTKTNIWFYPSNLKITVLDLEDKKRMKNKVKEDKEEVKKENKEKSKKVKK